MNKQQLAAKIWESANKMRSKIEANEYKDYILGFIFYKFLSEKEVKYLKANDWTDEYLPELTEEETETVESIQKNLGYFISYDNLFSTWLAKGSDFSVQDVRDALSAFSRLINPTHKKVFEGVFDTLQTGLSKLGDSAASQSKSISDLIQLIKDIPMDGKQGYDVLGFIYEYLIEKFAANAGKKAGEFYTPHEVSLLMSEIVANHLMDREKIEIFDPTSGSGSLLINIGKSASKYIEGENKVKYYAQELKQNTYNLTRMNLVMRGIEADNIVTRNGDTLEDDWPYFDENDRIGTYNPLYVDAVVSNPPYSQNWNPADKETDPRYAGYGLAPKGKADYAFLLHDLYHIKPDGIMTIVLPHGVLFRGGEEGEIRKNLIEKNKIDTIIGLPASIFYGTGIPTIIMVLKQKRANTDVLIVDASKGFIKEGKNNKLRASDIKRIVDVVTRRESVEKYSKVVSRDEIRANDYNLNIPRYVDSSDAAESWDIYASMFGGLPISEIDELKEYWRAFPVLRSALFENTSSEHCKLIVDDIKKAIKEHADVKNFESEFQTVFGNFDEYLYDELIAKMESLSISKTEEILSENIFARMTDIPLVDKYEAYQLLDDDWTKIAVDLEIIQTEGFSAAKVVDPNMVIKKKDGKEQEVQEGWKGHIIPFELVQHQLLNEDVKNLGIDENRMNEIASEYEELMDALSDDDKQKLLDDDNTSFVAKEVTNACKEVFADISTPEIEILQQYRDLSKAKDKLSFAEEHKEIAWESMSANKNGTYGKAELNKYITALKYKMSFEEGSYEYIVVRANALIAEEKELKKAVKEKAAQLHLKTKETIEGLSDEQVIELLKEKWIKPLIDNLMQLPDSIVAELVAKLETLAKKYETTFAEVETQIEETEKSLSAMIDDLDGSEFDMLGLAELKKLLGGCAK
ncbi:MAG: type I restriction-modification system subunit M [Bacillota bacterium]|nr:type I restriction-modification system subunit M [Bacillota bacterium]